MYIAGYGRNASTALGNLVAARREIDHWGELTNVHRIANRREHSCSCGKDISDCPQWGSVAEAMRHTEERRVPEDIKYLFLPWALLRRITDRRVRSDDIVTSYSILERPEFEGSFVDSSKSTWKSCARPLFISCLGAPVSLYAGYRPLDAVLASRLRAADRNSTGVFLLRTKTIGALFVAEFCARVLQWRLGDRIRVLTEPEIRANVTQSLPSQLHVIGGNRMRLAASETNDREHASTISHSRFKKAVGWLDRSRPIKPSVREVPVIALLDVTHGDPLIQSLLASGCEVEQVCELLDPRWLRKSVNPVNAAIEDWYRCRRRVHAIVESGRAVVVYGDDVVKWAAMFLAVFPDAIWLQRADSAGCTGLSLELFLDNRGRRRELPVDMTEPPDLVTAAIVRALKDFHDV